MTKKKVPDNYNFEDIDIGRTFEFEHILSEEDINAYANLIGDFNPLHIDKEYAKTTIYKGKISHGMLAASLFSTLLGMYCPGKDSIILSLNAKFKRPIKPNIKLKVYGEITKKVDSLKMLSVKLSLSDDQHILIDGEAKVKKL